MRRLAGTLVLFVAASLAWAEGAKQYPLTLKVLRTDAVTYTDTTQTTRTNCTSTPGSDDAIALHILPEGERIRVRFPLWKPRTEILIPSGATFRPPRHSFLGLALFTPQSIIRQRPVV